MTYIEVHKPVHGWMSLAGTQSPRPRMSLSLESFLMFCDSFLDPFFVDGFSVPQGAGCGLYVMES